MGWWIICGSKWEQKQAGSKHGRARKALRVGQDERKESGLRCKVGEDDGRDQRESSGT